MSGLMMTDKQWQELQTRLQMIVDRLQRIEMTLGGINTKVSYRLDDLETRVDRLEVA